MNQFVQPARGLSQLYSFGLFVLAMFAMSALQTGRLDAAPPPNVLDLPQLLQKQAVENLRAVELLRQGDYVNAKLLLRQCVLRVPHDLMAVYNLACVCAKMDDKDEAIEMLRAALKLGFRAKRQIEQDEDLKSLRELPEYAEVLKGCDAPPLKQSPGWNYPVTIATNENGSITIDSPNMLWSPQNKAMQVFVDVGNSGKDRLVAGTTGAMGDKIMQWFGEGTAAGNVGDLYDNHDRGHAPLDLKKFPQLTQLRYGPEVQKRQMDNGAQALFIYMNAQVKDGKAAEAGQPVEAKSLTLGRTIVIGNSSTAMTGSAFWRSMPRLMATSNGGIEVLMQQYTNNQLYVYPEHKDHDPGHDDASGWGDVYFANLPFYLISQGSSYSDQPLLESLAAALSALRPDTKQKLKDSGLIAPTLQMIFRRCYQPVDSDDKYLSGIAHPTVFEGNQVKVEAMVDLAQSIKADEVPPVAMIKVLKEETANPNIDYFDSQPFEAIFTTPFGLSRICHSTKYWRELVVSGVDSKDLNKRPLTYHWVVLRGDPQRVQIEQQLGNRLARRIRVGYQPRHPVQPGSPIESNRVDIALFVHNGVYYSAPAIMSFHFPENELRVYDDRQRIVSVDYRNAQKNYIDPALIAEKRWMDDYHYDEQGKLTGWTRTRGEATEQFNAEGQLLIQSGTDSVPHDVNYVRQNYPDGRPFIKQQLADE